MLRNRLHPLREQIPLTRRLLRLAVPTALSNLTVPLAGLIDVGMLGHLGALEPLAGVELGSVLFDYLYWSFGFLFMATQGLTAQAVGRGDRREETAVLCRALLLALLIGATILILRTPIREVGFRLLTGSETVEQAGRHYFDGRIWGALAALVNFVLSGWFLAKEKSLRVLTMNLSAAVVNIVLDYLFIYRFGLGAYGAGLATMAGQLVMLTCGLAFLIAERPALTGLRSSLLSRREFRSLFQLNRDLLIRTFCLISAFALFTNLSALLGTLVLAANGVLLKILSFAAYFIDGFAFATQSLAGIFKGQHDRVALARTLALSMAGGGSIALAVMATLLLFPGQIYGLLTSHPELVGEIERFDGWFYATLLFGAAAYIYDGWFIGLTEGARIRNAMIVAMLVCFLPLALLAWQLSSNHLLWLAFTAFMAARALTLAWQQQRVLNESAAPRSRP